MDRNLQGKHGWVRSESASDADPLLLTAGMLVRVLPSKCRVQSDALHELDCLKTRNKGR